MKQNSTFISAAKCMAMVIFACMAAGICSAGGITPEKEESTRSPSGRISLPCMGSLTGNRVEVSGYIKNLNAEKKFVWLVIDLPEKGVCWPQNSALSSNGRFFSVVNATGHVNSFILSLYAVDKEENEKILSWLASDKSKGLTLLPPGARLHSIRLWNQKLDM